MAGLDPVLRTVDIALQLGGYEVAARLRAQHTQLLLIALTGYRQDDVKLQAAGFDHHLIKPLDLQVLSA